MAAYRSADKIVLRETLAASQRFLSELDIGPINKALIDDYWGKVVIPDVIDRCDTDENLAEVMRPVVSFLRLFKNVIRFHALTDPPRWGQKTGVRALDVYKNLLSWSAFTPAGGSPAVNLSLLNKDADGDYISTESKRKYENENNEANHYVLFRELCMVSEEDLTQDSEIYMEAQTRIAACQLPDDDEKSWAKDGLRGIYGWGRAGCLDEVYHFFTLRPLGMAAVMEGLHVLSGLRVKEEALKLSDSMQVYQAILGSISKDDFEEGEKEFQPLRKIFINAALKIAKKGDLCPGLLNCRSLPSVSPDLRCRTENAFFFKFEPQESEATFLCRVFFTATAQGADGMAVKMQKPVSNLAGVTFFPKP